MLGSATQLWKQQDFMLVTSPRIHLIVVTTGADFKVLTIAGKKKLSDTRSELFRMSSDDDPCRRGQDPCFMFERKFFLFVFLFSFKQQQSENKGNPPWNRNLWPQCSAHISFFFFFLHWKEKIYIQYIYILILSGGPSSLGNILRLFSHLSCVLVAPALDHYLETVPLIPTRCAAGWRCLCRTCFRMHVSVSEHNLQHSRGAVHTQVFKTTLFNTGVKYHFLSWWL